MVKKEKTVSKEVTEELGKAFDKRMRNAPKGFLPPEKPKKGETKTAFWIRVNEYIKWFENKEKVKKNRKKGTPPLIPNTDVYPS